MDGGIDLKDTLRGIIGVLVVAFGPGIVGLVMTRIALRLGLHSLANASFGVALLWAFLFLPLWNLIPSLAGSTAWVLAVTQWALVGVVVGRLIVRKSWIRAVALTLTIMVVATVLVHVLIRVLGYQIIVEGP